jgi:type III secretion protein W
MYRNITGTFREPLDLFEDLTTQFNFQKLKTVISFLLHALGADMKAKGPSISTGELAKLIAEVRSLQGIMGIFRFFKSRMRLIKSQYASSSLTYPSKLNFEILSRVFAKLLAERFVNPDKILELLRLLALTDEAEAQMILCTQFRDAVKQVAPKYYRNIQHRDELLSTIIDTIDTLEDQIEDEEE